MEGMLASRVTVTLTVAPGCRITLVALSDSHGTSDVDVQLAKPGRTSDVATGGTNVPPGLPPIWSRPHALAPRYTDWFALGRAAQLSADGSYAYPWLVIEPPLSVTPPETSSSPLAATLVEPQRSIGMSARGDQLSVAASYWYVCLVLPASVVPPAQYRLALIAPHEIQASASGY